MGVPTAPVPLSCLPVGPLSSSLHADASLPRGSCARRAHQNLSLQRCLPRSTRGNVLSFWLCPVAVWGAFHEVCHHVSGALQDTTSRKIQAGLRCLIAS